MSGQSFQSGERLKSRKEIQRLFQRGNSFAQFPLRFVWVPAEERRSEYPVQFAVSVPKRKFKRAVDRNRLRRQVREAYRLQKANLYRALEGRETQIALMVLYTAAEALPYGEIEQSMAGLVRRLGKKAREANEQ